MLLIGDLELDSLLEQALASGGGERAHELKICADLAEISRVAIQEQAAGRGVVFVLRQIRTTDDLKAQLQFCKKLRPVLNRQAVVLIGINWVAHAQVPSILRKMGFSEVIYGPALKPAVLKSRIDLIIEGWAQFGGRAGDLPENLPKTMPDTLNDTRIVIRGNSFEFVEPLEFPENCWLLRAPEDIKVVHDQWVIDLIGPGGALGEWRRQRGAEVRPSDSHSVWEWKPRDLGGLGNGAYKDLLDHRGTWVFHGKRPRFSEFHWTFISKEPKLAYCTPDEMRNYLSVSPTNHKLLLPMNAQTAIAKWPTIHASIFHDYRYQKKAPIICPPTIRALIEEGGSGPDLPGNFPNQEGWYGTMGFSAEAAQTVQAEQAKTVAKITQTLQPKEKLFNPIQDSDRKLQYLKELLSFPETPVEIWSAQQKLRYHSRATQVSCEEQLVAFAPPTTPIPDPVTRLYMAIGFKRSALFCALESSEFEFNEKHLLVRMPDVFYEVQRRSFFRLPISADEDFFVAIQSKYHRVKNLSGGGLALSIEPDQKDSFTKGTRLDSVEFEIHGRSISCQGEVRWIGAAEAGIRFEGLDPDDRQQINSFVLEQAFDYLSESLEPSPLSPASV